MIRDGDGRPAGRGRGAPRAAVTAATALLLVAAGAAATYLMRGAAGRAPAPPAGRPSLLLVTIDTLRADRLGCYGYAAGRTPAIDRLAAGGVLFEQAVSAAPVTLPSFVSILTGTYPAHHGVLNNVTYRLGDEAVTLAEVLGARRYATAAIVASYPLLARFGLSQGFDHYDDRLPPERERQITYRERPAAEVTGAAIAWLEEHRGEMFFLWLHYFDPHAPYAPPSPYAAEFARDPYDGEIAYVDSEVGALLRRMEELGLDRDTLVALVADHGEGLGEHGEATHGVFLYESTLRVPMILSFPGVLPAGRRIDEPVRTIDLLPTLVALLGAEPPPGIQGASLLPMLSRPPERPPRAALSETVVPRENYGWSELAALRVGHLKYVLAPREELYDLASDPRETTNLAARRPRDLERIREELGRLMESMEGNADRWGERHELDEAARARLRALGYLWTRGAAAGAALPDPKDRIGLLRTLHEARTLYARGDFRSAADMCGEILKSDPDNLTARMQRGNARIGLGDARGAAADFEAVLTWRPRSAEALQNLGSALLGLGELGRAEQAFRRVLQLEPESARAVTGLGLVLIRRGRNAEAAGLFRRALDLDPASDEARQRLAAALEAVDRDPDSEAIYRRALQEHRADADAAVGLARLLYRDGRFDAVIALLEESVRAGADTPEIRFALANARFRRGDAGRAAGDYERVLASRPGHAGALFGSALVALQQGRTADAMALLERARAADPANAEIERNLAILNDEAGNDAAAIEGYGRALALDPAARDIRFHLGRVYARSGRPRLALEQYRAYLAGGEGEFAAAARREVARLERR